MSTGTTAGTTSNNSSSSPSSPYRLKFERDEFLKLLEDAKPPRVYKVKDFIYFSFDGFVMYCEELTENDLVSLNVFNAIEFSNSTWRKTASGIF